MNNYVRVSREFFDDEAFADEALTEREAFLWLIFEASFKAREKRIGPVVVTLARGQVAASTRFMAKAWQWSEARVRRYLDRLKNRRMVSCVADAGVTVVTLCNYDKYQAPERVADAAATQQPTQQRRTGDANENKDAIREERKREAKASLRATRFDEFWNTYPHRNGTKKGKPSAVKSYGRAVARGIPEQTIIDGANSSHRHPDVIRGYARDPTTWLNAEGWTDEIGQIVPIRPERTDGRPSRSTESLDAFLAGARRLPG